MNGAVDAKAWDDRYRQADLVWKAEPNVFVAQHASRLSVGEAIDLGAGEGRNSVWLARNGWQVTAVDFSAVALEKAREMAVDTGVSIATVVSDALHFHPVEPVDLVLLCYLQLPDDQQVRVLRNAASWLKPGGSVLVVAHDKANVHKGHGGPPDPALCYTVEQTMAALDGLQVAVAEVARRKVDDAVALDTVVLASRPA